MYALTAAGFLVLSVVAFSVWTGHPVATPSDPYGAARNTSPEQAPSFGDHRFVSTSLDKDECTPLIPSRLLPLPSRDQKPIITTLTPVTTSLESQHCKPPGAGEARSYRFSEQAMECPALSPYTVVLHGNDYKSWIDILFDGNRYSLQPFVFREQYGCFQTLGNSVTWLIDSKNYPRFMIIPIEATKWDNSCTEEEIVHYRAFTLAQERICHVGTWRTLVEAIEKSPHGVCSDEMVKSSTP